MEACNRCKDYSDQNHTRTIRLSIIIFVKICYLPYSWTCIFNRHRHRYWLSDVTKWYNCLFAFVPDAVMTRKINQWNFIPKPFILRQFTAATNNYNNNNNINTQNSTLLTGSPPWQLLWQYSVTATTSRQWQNNPDMVTTLALTMGPQRYILMTLFLLRSISEQQ